MNKEDKVLAIDFGTVRIGLALSHYTLAEPLKIIVNNKETFNQLKEVCEKEEVRIIVIGVSENEMERKTREFAKKLQKDIQTNWIVKPAIVFTDETLSSYSAHQKLKFHKKSKRSAPVDHLSASIFLQEWLDEKVY